MTRNSTAASGVASPGLDTALAEMTASFERFCLAAGLEALGEMMGNRCLRPTGFSA